MADGHILVIDDEYGVRSGIHQILELEGYRVDEAETGEEALRKLDAAAADGGFDVALIDYRLPDIDGLTLLQGIKDRGLDIMTCMITAYANIDTAIAATRQGIDFFLPKPFLPDDLLGVIDTLLRHRLLRAETERLRREHEAGLLALAEEKSQTHSLVANLRDAVLVVNRDGDAVLANRAMTDLLAGVAAAAAAPAAGDPAAAAVPELPRPVADVLAAEPFAAIREHLQAGERDRVVQDLDLGEQSYMASVVTFRGDDGTALGRILTLSDISEMRRMTMEKARFVRTMVHELRSPMGAVKSLIEVCLDKSLGDEIDLYLPMLERATSRIDNLSELIGDLLSLSRIDMERGVERELLDVAPVIGEVVELQRETMAARGITAAIEVSPDLPQALVNADDLRTILVNLTANAVKYNRDGGTVTVRAFPQGAAAAHHGGAAASAGATGAEDAGWLRIDVRDTGIGIKADNLEHVFDEFFREKRRETREIEGNGLGLSIVKRLADRCGGRLQAASIEGEGSTFSLLLPA
jgi:signal transduction histidine kinase/DNA-binding NarL/FixJ family response regulator